MIQRESQIGMKRSRQTCAGRNEPAAGRSALLVSRFAPVLACLLLLSGCANLADWIPDLDGGEGRFTTPVPPGQGGAAPVPPGPPSHEVRAVQSDLAELGYDPGPIDGAMGPRTEAAIREYQKSAGMEVDGMVTERLIASLAAAVRPENTIWAGLGALDADLESEPVHVENADIPPLYNVGDAYIWSDGQVETVARVAGNKLFWQADDGKRYTADSNFLIPPSSWTGPAGSGEAYARVDTRASWPLKSGTPLVFQVSSGGEYREWQCNIDRSERVSVPAGRFDVIALACERNPAPAGEWVRREWLYAPAVRHYVARIDILAGGGRRRIDLVGIRPGAEDWPPAARAGLDRAIQDTLANLPDGEHGQWSSTVVTEEFEIRPGPIRNNRGGGRCRRFDLTARSAENSRTYPALACTWSVGKKWRIPGDADERPNGLSLVNSAG